MILWLVFAVLTAVAVLAVLAPLSRPAPALRAPAEADLSVYRDQLEEVERDLARGIIGSAEAEAARAEVARRMIAADARRKAAAPASAAPRRIAAVVWGVAAALPLMTLGVYLAFGAPHLPGQPLHARLTAPPEQQEVEVLIARVERHLAENPQDGRGWEVLAPVYGRLGRHTDAVRAWRNAVRLLGPTPERLSHYGEAIVLASDGVVTDAARDAFEAALADAPDAPQPRFYMAMAAEQDGEWSLAVERWRALVADAPADAPWRGVAAEQLAAAEQAAGVTAPETPLGPAAEDVAAAAQMSAEERADFINSMVSRLAERLAADGHDLDGWLRLARAHAVLGDTDEAKAALAGARRHFEGDAEAAARIDAAARALGLDS